MCSFRHVLEVCHSHEATTPSMFHNGAKDPPGQRTSVLNNSLVRGCLLGAIESTGFYWTVTWGFAKLHNQPLPSNIKSYYSGYILHTSFVVPLFASIVGINEFLSRRLKHSDSPEWSVKILCAGIAGVASAFLNPMETCLIARGPMQEASPIRTWIRLYQTVGMAGFFRGSFLTCARNTLYSFGLNAWTPFVAKQVERALPDYEKTTAYVLSAALCGGVAGVISQPFHVLNFERKRDYAAKLYSSDFDLIKKTFKGSENPWRGLYRASMPRIIRCSGGSALVWLFMQSLDKKGL